MENSKEQTFKLLDNKDSNFNSSHPVIVKISNDECPIAGNSVISSCSSSKIYNNKQQNESLLGSFHKHLIKSPFNKVINETSGPIARFRQSCTSARRIRTRVIFKQGECNVVQGDVAKRRKRYMQDIFTTLVDAQWRWMMLVFACNFLVSWAIFAVIWWAIAYLHGDIDYLNLQEEMKENGIDINDNTNDTFIMCVTEINSLTSAFLFSVETQHTIGYGNRFLTEECPEAIFLMSFQSIAGVFIQAFMVGIIFAKLSRPKKRAQTLLFSTNAVICHRDSIPCFMFRVGDMRKSHIIEARVRAQIMRRKITKEGEEVQFYQQELKVGVDGSEDRLMFIWPTTIVHQIDHESPLYNLSANDMLKESFEIVVMLEGVVESTGMTTQARSSYLPSEILWGHRFEHVVNFRKEIAEYEVDYLKFNNTYEIDTPLCSSKQLSDLRSQMKSKHEYASSSDISLHQQQQQQQQSNESINKSSIDRLQIQSNTNSNNNSHNNNNNNKNKNIKTTETFSSNNSLILTKDQ